MRNKLTLKFLLAGAMLTGFTALPVWAGNESSRDTDPIDVLQGADFEGAKQPQVAVGPEGQVAIAFGVGSTVYCVTSRTADDAGALEFGRPVKLGTISKLALGLRRGPRVVWTDEALVVTALGHEQGNVWSWRSTDHGQSWQEPVQVNDVDQSAREGLHAMAAGPAGLIYCIWLDLRSGKMQIMGTASRDGGQSWEPNRLVYQSPGGAVCECCHPSVTIDAQERVYVLFRNSLDGNRDMYLTTSQDGVDFEPARRLGLTSWQLKACPMDGGAVAVSPQGDITTIWRRDRDIISTTPNRVEQLLDQGEQPWATATRSGAYLAWLSRRGGALKLLVPDQKVPQVLADEAGDPVVACKPGGKPPVVVVWEAELDGRRTIQAKVVEKAGK